ncbi:MAG: L,D-transpeptidase family protein [Alphaproteobacteria bacterium]|nr:L,D-transpeptidase family protein [Alphaproteobacteria bacterium]
MMKIVRQGFVPVLAAAMLLSAGVSLAADPVKSEKPAVQKAAALKKAGWKDFSGAHIGENRAYEATYEDTLITIARGFNLGFVELRAANPFVDPWMPGEGAKMTLPAMHLLPPGPRRGIVINLPEMRMYAYLDSGRPPESYPLGIGREGLLTPSGTTTVVRKADGPTWRPTPRMRAEDPTLPAVVPPGPDNPMGTHAMYLGWPQYAIHGTNKPYGIGRRSSSGCLRMYPEDIVKLYGRVPVGMNVTVVNEPVKAAWVDNKFYIEAHPTMEHADRMERDGGLLEYELSPAEMTAIMNAAGDDAHHIDWGTLRQVIRERNGMPIVVATRPRGDTAQDPDGKAERI